MNKISILLCALLIAGSLTGCASKTSTPAQLPIANGSLGTAEAYLSRGDQYFAIKDYDQAIADYTQAIALKADFAEAYNNRGLAYALKGKDQMANAIVDYSQAIQIRSNYAYAINNRGVAYMASGHPEEAIQDFNRAIQLVPDFPQAHSNRGNYYLREHRTDLAVIDFFYSEKTPVLLMLITGCILLLAVVFTLREIRRRVIRNRLKKLAGV